MTERGKFIVIEGIDGAGTTTLARELEIHLRGEVPAVQATFEPTATQTGVFIREFLNGKYPLMGWRAMAMLFSADRYDHCDWIEEWLEAGSWVICDRYRWSTFAYQTASAAVTECKGLEGQERMACMSHLLGWLEKINADALAPDMTVMLDIDPKVALKRVDKGRKAPREVYEKKAFLDVVAEVYERLVDLHTPSMDGVLTTIDASQSIDTVTDECWDEVKRVFL